MTPYRDAPGSATHASKGEPPGNGTSPPGPATVPGEARGGGGADLWARAIPAFVHGGWPAVLTLALLLLAWVAVAYFVPDPYDQFPGPAEVGDRLVGLVTSGDLWPQLSITMERLFKGVGISLAIGGALALAMARWNAVQRGLKPYLLGMQSLPSIAWVPLAVIWFGFDESFYLFITVIGSLFAVALAFTDALASVRPAHVLAARNMGAHGLGLIALVKIPAATPSIISGVKQCWSFAWRSLLGAEIVIVTAGLGDLLNTGREFQDTALVMAVMAVTLLVGLLFEVLLFARVEAWVRRRWGLA